jgi:hypothetical protein
MIGAIMAGGFMIHCSICEETKLTGCICPGGNYHHQDEFIDSLEDWELLGMDPQSSQEEIDREWDNQM